MLNLGRLDTFLKKAFYQSSEGFVALKQELRFQTKQNKQKSAALRSSDTIILTIPASYKEACHIIRNFKKISLMYQSVFK